MKVLRGYKILGKQEADEKTFICLDKKDAIISLLVNLIILIIIYFYV